jgi:hypothetical protein
MPPNAAGGETVSRASRVWYAVIVYVSRDGGARWREYMRGQHLLGGSGDMTTTINHHLAALRGAHPGLLFQAEAYHPSVRLPPQG